MLDAIIHLIGKMHKSLMSGFKKTIRDTLSLQWASLILVSYNRCGLFQSLVAILGSLIEFLLDADELVVLRHAVGA